MSLERLAPKVEQVKVEPPAEFEAVLPLNHFSSSLSKYR
jgi:hypothetical protein